MIQQSEIRQEAQLPQR